MVAELVKRFLEHHAGNSKPATYSFYCRPLNSFVHFIGAMRVCDLKPYHVTQWINSRRAAKRARKLGDKYLAEETGRAIGGNFQRNLIRAVKACFKWAEDQEYIERSPVRKVRVPPPVARGDEAYLMPDQWEKLASAVAKSQDGGALLDLITVMKETGCRPQEVRRVEAQHFDRAGRCWILPKREAKGGREARIIHLSDKAFEICQRLALKRPEGPLFRNGNGKPWTTGVLDGRCQRISRKLGFCVTPYSIRHTFATDAIIRGVDLQTIATIMGHTDLKMLSKVYQHIRKRSDHIKEGLRKATGEVA
jgi:integrase